MGRVLRISGKIVIAGIISIIVLSLFVHVYCDSGVHIHSKTGETDWHYESYQNAVNYEEGFGQLRMDEKGYNNEVVFPSEATDVLLMGSSHMEAANVNGNENTAFVLNHSVSENVYNIGISGHTIYHIASNFLHAVSEYNPTTIIIETDTIALNVDNMIKVKEDAFPNIKVYDSGVLYNVQKYLPAVKYLFNKVDLWKNADHTAIVTTTVDCSAQAYTDQLNAFLMKIRADADDRDVIIFYHPKTKIDREGNYIDSTDPVARTAFISACEENNITFLDMTDYFETLYNEQHILAHGFANTAVGYGHLNKYGHALIAQELAKVIQGVEE